MKARTFAVSVLVWVLASVPGMALKWSDLSPAAQRIVPEKRAVMVHLKNGLVREGVITEETEDAITVLHRSGTIESEMEFSREQIDRIEEKDLCAEFRTALDVLQYEEQRQYTEAQSRNIVAVIDEYMRLCPDGENLEPLEERRASFAFELEQLQKGMQKIMGEWLTPVAASIRQFDVYNERLAQLMRRFPGVERPNFRGEQRAVEVYNQLVEDRRQVARALPELVNRRIPQLIEESSYREAAGELTSFTRFWITRVIHAEAGGARRPGGDVVREVFQGMDFGFINRLQQRVYDAWMEDHEPDPRAGEVGEDGMVYIPGGFFLMGDPDADIRADNFPLRIIYLKPYWMDQYEVTNEAYREFVEHVKRTGDYSMAHPDAPPLKDHTPKGWSIPALAGDNQPVVGVDWFDAYAYAKWRGKRLPTEAEWEHAARGPDKRLYPWGNEPARNKVVNWVGGRQYLEGEINRAADGQQTGTVRLPEATWNVDALRPPQDRRRLFEEEKDAIGPWGLYHMAGNAAEWVGDRYDPEGYARLDLENPTGSPNGDTRVYRGGSFRSANIEELNALYRNARAKGQRGNVRPPAADLLIGFRCVQDTDPE